MSKTRVRPALLNIANPLHKGQRSIDDVLVHITYRDGSPSVTQYASPGRAAMMLKRYSRARYIADSSTFALVEKVGAS
jgi:hypothetical protein